MESKVCQATQFRRQDGDGRMDRDDPGCFLWLGFSE